MHKEERKAHVLRLLARKRSVSVSELSQDFHISTVSVRTLLAEMEHEGSIQRIWGGAVLANPLPRPASQSEWRVPSQDQSIQELSKSEAIAKAAYDQICDGETVFLGGDLPAMQRVASLLANGNKRRTLICTNSLPIALEFARAKDIQLLFIGGQLRHESLSCLGRATRQSLENLSFDKCFLSVRYFSIERGFSTGSPLAAEVKRTLLTVTNVSYFLMDSSAYGQDALSLISPCEPGRRLITDQRLPAEGKERLEAKGMQVILAPIGH